MMVCVMLWPPCLAQTEEDGEGDAADRQIEEEGCHEHPEDHARALFVSGIDPGGEEAWAEDEEIGPDEESDRDAHLRPLQEDLRELSTPPLPFVP